MPDKCLGILQAPPGEVPALWQAHVVSCGSCFIGVPVILPGFVMARVMESKSNGELCVFTY